MRRMKVDVNIRSIVFKGGVAEESIIAKKIKEYKQAGRQGSPQ